MKDEFHSLAVVDIRRETADTVSYGLSAPAQLRDVLRYRPGQHLPVRAVIEGREVRRTYSISSGPEDGHIWITVKRVAGGLFSTHLHKNLAPGAVLDAMPPAGRFVVPLEPDQQHVTQERRTYLAIAAGSGITPIMAMIRHVMAREPGSRFALMYGNRSPDSIIFREALEDLKDRYLDRLSVMHVLSRDQEPDVPLLGGRIDGTRIAKLMPAVAPVSEIDHVYLCGPGDLITSARAALLGMGMARDRIHFEYFRAGADAAPPRAPSRSVEPSAPSSGAEAVVVMDGARHTFRVPPGTGVVDAALAAGIRVPYSCKGGMCCTCRAKLVEGEVVMQRNFSLERWEIAAGFVLTCQAHPQTSRVVLDYDQM